MLRYFLSTLALLIVVVLAATFLFLNRTKPQWEVTRGSVVAWEECSGETIPGKEYPLRVFQSADVVDKQVMRGDEVEKGDRLLTLILGSGREVRVYAHRSGIVSFITSESEVEKDDILVKITGEDSDLGEIVLTSATSVSIGDKAKVEYSQREISAEVTELEMPWGGEDGLIRLRLREALPLYDNFHVKIVTDFRNNVLLVPNTALSKRDGEYFVLVENGLFDIQKKVELGLWGNDYSEVLAGLNEGERVLLQK